MRWWAFRGRESGLRDHRTLPALSAKAKASKLKNELVNDTTVATAHLHQR